MVHDTNRGVKCATSSDSSTAHSHPQTQNHLVCDFPAISSHRFAFDALTLSDTVQPKYKSITCHSSAEREWKGLVVYVVCRSRETTSWCPARAAQVIAEKPFC